MATQRRIRFGGSDGPVLPRSSQSGGQSPKRSDKLGVIKSLLMVASLVGTVYFLTRSSRSLEHTDLASTGEGEGLEDIMWSRDHDHHSVQDRHHQHDTHAHQLHKLAVGDDGSIIVKAADKPAVSPPALPPAHAVGGGAASHTGSGTVGAGSNQPQHADSGADILPDPAEEPNAAPHHHQHPAHAARVDGRTPAAGLYALSALDIDSRERHLSEFAGRVTLVVNVASQCGYTDANYKGLQEVYAKYHPHGFEILAFPSNEFGNQEPGSTMEIKAFATDRYHAAFPLFSKVQVNGPNAHPVFQFLKRELPVDQGGGGSVAAGRDIGWNFYKFLVGRDGKPVKLFHQDWHQGVIEHAVYELLVDPQHVLDSGMHHA